VSKATIDVLSNCAAQFELSARLEEQQLFRMFDGKLQDN